MIHLEYPWPKVALGIKDGEIQYGGAWSELLSLLTTKVSKAGKQLEEIFGGDTDAIPNKLTAYYSSDTDIRKEQFENYLALVKKSKKLPTCCSFTIL